MKVQNLPPLILEKGPIDVLEKEKSKNEQLLAYYEEAGPDYAHWSPSFNMHFGFYEWGINPLNLESMLNNMNRQVLKWLIPNWASGKHLADFGCGLGTTLRYTREHHPNNKLSGVTLVPWQVDMAKKLNSTSKQYEDIEIIEANYCKTPFKDASLDGVLAIESSCYATGGSKMDLISEIYRVLKPGGRFVIADGFRKHDDKLPSFLDSVYKQLCKSWALSELGSINHMMNAIREIGFRSVEADNVSFRVAPSVAHVPFTVFTFLFKELLFGKRAMTKERWDNLKSPLLTMILGLAQRHFGYYIISGRKEY